MQLLEFSDLSRRYGAHWALSGASGTLQAGEVVALEGENGSGKSTLLLTLAGILKPHRGKAQFATGVRCHLVAHHPMAYTALAVLRNLELAAALHGKSAADINAATDYWQIGHLAPKPVATLSRGQMQRFLLARASLAGEKVLLLDEPFTGLDQNGERLLADFVMREARRGVGVFFSDHDAKRARALSQRSIRMREGRCLP